MLNRNRLFLFSSKLNFYKLINKTRNIFKVKSTWIPCKLCDLLLPSRLSMVSHKAKIHSKGNMRDATGDFQCKSKTIIFYHPIYRYWQIQMLFIKKNILYRTFFRRQKGFQWSYLIFLLTFFYLFRDWVLSSSNSRMSR